MEYCDQHVKNSETLAVITNELSHIRQLLETWGKRVDKHIDKGEKPGGIREIVANHTHEIVAIVKEVEAVKRGYIFSGILGGVIGALIGEAAPQVVQLILRLLGLN